MGTTCCVSGAVRGALADAASVNFREMEALRPGHKPMGNWRAQGCPAILSAQGQRSLVGYHPQGCTELDTTEAI